MKPLSKHWIKCVLTQKTVTKPATWWTTKLHNLRVQVKNAFREWKKAPNQEKALEKYEIYKSTRKEN